MANRWGNNGNSDRLFSWAPKSLWMVTTAMKLKDAFFLEETLMTNLDRDITLLTKVCLVKAIVFPVVMHGCESWKAEHRRIVDFELWCWRKLDSPLDYKEIKLVNPKGNQSQIFIGRTDAEAEALIL